jgi:hypothetical protein
MSHLPFKAEPFGPDRQRAQQRDAFGDFVPGQIGVFVDEVAALGVLIEFGTPALDDFQRRPARAVEKIVEQRDGSISRLGGSAFTTIGPRRRRRRRIWALSVLPTCANLGAWKSP